ncbi:MAG TPA: UbiX family flavin prenyltransferase [archaeon]|nr:UbiX family flavin prenyltransferase [archaeon]
MKIVLAVTGASGVVYGVNLASELAKAGTELTIVVSDAAKRVLAEETHDGLKHLKGYGKLLTEHDIDAEVASGSAKTDAVVVCPCSMKTVAAIASGYAYNLICRTADVAIKEQRKLVLVVREMPLSAIHLENMLKLARLGAVILPASPGFYHEPKTVNDMVNHVIGKVLDVLGVESKLYKRWSG